MNFIVNSGLEFSSNKYNNTNDGDIKFINVIAGIVVQVASNKLECTKSLLDDCISSNPENKQKYNSHPTPKAIITIKINKVKLKLRIDFMLSEATS